MELQEALAQIAEIRARISRTDTFRGYRSATVAFSGTLAIAAGVVQAICIADPQQNVSAYLTLWISAAALSLVVTGFEMALRCRHAASSWTTRITLMAVEQFLPCVLAVAIVTTVLVRVARESLWMLPGLWAILFGLGVFASYRLLPRPVFWVGGFYLFAGGVLLAIGPGEHALSPWAMAATFGTGQLLSAMILYLTLERPRDAQ
jgi:hypothetical protein